jgi:hypothetical protein
VNFSRRNSVSFSDVHTRRHRAVSRFGDVAGCGSLSRFAAAATSASIAASIAARSSSECPTPLRCSAASLRTSHFSGNASYADAAVVVVVVVVARSVVVDVYPRRRRVE